MEKKNHRGSTQKELMDGKKSLSSKYSLLFLGRRSFTGLLRFELVILLFSWVPGALGLFLRKIFYRSILGRVGRGVVFGRSLTFRHPHKIRIGDNAVIDDYAVLDAKGEDNSGITLGKNVYVGRNTILSCKEGSISIDDQCNISASCTILSETEVRLGKHCFLAGQCYLVAGGNHRFNRKDIPIMLQPSYSKGGIRIGEDVWLGAGVIVLDGVSIGRGSIVAAGSVVTSSLDEYALASSRSPVKVVDHR